MAVITRTVTPLVVVFPLRGLPQLQRQDSGIPRAVVNVEAPLQSVSGPGAGNQLQIVCDASLPANFAYAYLGTYVTTSVLDSSATTNDFTDPWIRIDPNNPQVPEHQCHMQTLSTMDNADPLWKHWKTASDGSPGPTEQIFWAPTGLTVDITSYTFNPDPNSGDSDYQFSQRFLQYDIEQAYDYPVNYSFPTR